MDRSIYAELKTAIRYHDPLLSYCCTNCSFKKFTVELKILDGLKFALVRAREADLSINKIKMTCIRL